MASSPDALRNRIFRRRRIYRRCGLSSGRCAQSPARPDHFISVGRQRSRRTVGRRPYHALTVHFLPMAALDVWGWRIPFLAGGALAAGVWLARSAMEESPDFERQRTEGTTPVRPLRDTLVASKGIARSLAISALGSITYYVGITYVPAFLVSAGALPRKNASLWLSTLAAVVVILVTPVVGLLSDRLGRRLVLVGLSLLSAVLPVTMFSLMASGAVARALSGAVVLAAVAGGVSAVGAVATAEQFPGRRPPQRSCPGNDHGDGGIRRLHPLAGADFGRAHRPGDHARCYDRNCRNRRAAGAVDLASLHGKAIELRKSDHARRAGSSSSNKTHRVTHRPRRFHPRIVHLALAMGGFAIGTTEFATMCLLPFSRMIWGSARRWPAMSSAPMPWAWWWARR